MLVEIDWTRECRKFIKVDKRRKQSTANNQQTRTRSAIFSSPRARAVLPPLLIRVKRIKKNVELCVQMSNRIKRRKKYQSRSVQILYSVLCSSFLFMKFFPRVFFHHHSTTVFTEEMTLHANFGKKCFCKIYCSTHSFICLTCLSHEYFENRLCTFVFFSSFCEVWEIFGIFCKSTETIELKQIKKKNKIKICNGDDAKTLLGNMKIVSIWFFLVWIKSKEYRKTIRE